MPDNPDDLIRALREPLAYLLGARGITSEPPVIRFTRYERLLMRVDGYLIDKNDEDLAALRKFVDGENNG